MIVRLLLSAIAVLVISYLLEPYVIVNNYLSAIIVAIVLAILKVTVRPLLIFFTLPATIVTLGLFIFVINAIIILLAGEFVSGFQVSGFWSALLFSVLLSVFESFLYSLFNKEQ